MKYALIGCGRIATNHIKAVVNNKDNLEFVADSWADPDVCKKEYGVDLVPFDRIPKADCVIVAVGHKEFRSMSVMQLKELFDPDLADNEKVLIDVKSLYRMDELKASGMSFWRL